MRGLKLRGLTMLAMLGSLACVETEPVRRLADTVRASPETLELPTGLDATGGWLGVEVAANESDSLEDLEVLPGARVVRVFRGAPAERAGLRIGDVILSVAQIEIGDPEALAATERALVVGARVRVVVRRDTTGLECELEVARSPDAGASNARELYRVEPTRIRAAFRTHVVEREGRAFVAAELRELLPESPLLGALSPGDLVLAIDGVPLRSAQDLVTRILALEPGRDVDLLVQRRDEPESTIGVALWSSPRRVTGLVVPVLFTYQAGPGTKTVRVLDLWLISLVSYERREGERTWRLLGFPVFQTGLGELEEQPSGAARPGVESARPGRVAP